MFCPHLFPSYLQRLSLLVFLHFEAHYSPVLFRTLSHVRVVHGRRNFLRWKLWVLLFVLARGACVERIRWVTQDFGLKATDVQIEMILIVGKNNNKEKRKKYKRGKRKKGKKWKKMEAMERGKREKIAFQFSSTSEAVAKRAENDERSDKC